MDWTKLVAELLDSGLKQAELAAELGVSQPTVSDLKRGEIKSPSYELGTAIKALHDARCQPKRSGAAAFNAESHPGRRATDKRDRRFDEGSGRGGR